MDAEHHARVWLCERGAESVAHAGGSLYDHLGRVHERLGRLGLDDDVRLAGLTHAAYGTDGFALALLDVADRTTLRTLIGKRAELQVYRYGACDRGRTWRALPVTGAIRNRFTGTYHSPTPGELRAFVDLTIVNELDVAEHDPTILARHGTALRDAFTRWARLASPAVTADAKRVLG